MSQICFWLFVWRGQRTPGSTIRVTCRAAICVIRSMLTHLQTLGTVSDFSDDILAISE